MKMPLALAGCLLFVVVDVGADAPTNGLVLHLEATNQIALRKKADLPPMANGISLDRWLGSGEAMPTARQPVGDRRPTLISNGLEALVRFDGKDDFLHIAGPRRRTREATIFLLAAPRGNVGGFTGMFGAAAEGRNDYTTGLNLDQGPEPTPAFTVFNAESVGGGGFHNFLASRKSAEGGIPFGNFHVLTLRSVVGPVGNEVFVDGMLCGTSAREESSIGLDEMVVGGRIYSNEAGEPSRAQGFFHGDIAAALVYDRALPDAERTRIEQALFARIPALNALASGRSGHALETLRDAPPVQMLVPGFTVEELPLSLRNQNNLRYRHDGKLVALGYDGRIHLVTDTDSDGREDRATIFWDKSTLRGPLGMALLPKGDPRGEGVLVGSKGKISLILDRDRDGVGDEEIIVATGWKEIPQNVDAVGMAVDPKDGSIYFCLGTANYANGYLIDAATGRSDFDLAGDRGTIQKVSADFLKRETVCTGVRFACALAFNRQGDLFATEQEGATWLPNGNPFDELLHIVPGRHYGFPPRHPRHLPQVIDEPAVFEYAPQHQSTVGMVFNEGVNGGPSFGPARWRGDAIVCGESRGKIYRTKLVKTAEGYVAQNQVIACLGLLTIDACISPKGDLLISCHSGPPDWGTGPAGDGRIFRVRYTNPQTPQPTLAWAAGPDEFRIAFDQPLRDADWAGAREKTRIEAGRYVGAGDRFETIRPGYQVVRDQISLPRRWVEVQSLSLSADRRTIVLRAPRQTETDTYAITLPLPAAWQAQGGIPQRPEMDLALSLQGVQATVWTSSGSTRLMLPHPSPAITRELTAGSAEHEEFFRKLDAAGDTVRLELRGGVNLANIFVPAIQPGASLDWDIGTDNFANRVMTVRQDFSTSAPRDVSLTPDPATHLAPLKISLAGKLAFTGSGLTFALDDRQRPISLNRFSAPWAFPRSENREAPNQMARTDVTGSWLHGRRVFFGDGGCATCHTIRGEGTIFGPDLSNLIYRDRESVLQDISKPSATINPDQSGSLVKFSDGSEINGIVRTLSADKIIIHQPAGVVTERPRPEVTSIEPMKGSLMPEGFGESIPAERMEDLLTFLLTNPLEPAVITRLDPGPPPARSRAEIAEFITMQPPESGLKPLRILLCIDDQDHGLNEHDYPVWRERWAKLLALADHVTVTTADGFPTREQLAAVDVTVFYSRNSGWSRPASEVLDEYQKRGGGLVYLHWGMEGRDEADLLAERIGLATGGSKYRHGETELVFTQPGHLITQGFTRLHLTDETYWQFHGDPARVTTLAAAVEENEPRTQLWAFEHGAGRVFGSIPGHYTWTFDDPLYRVLVLRGIAWAAHETNVNRLIELATVGARIAP